MTTIINIPWNENIKDSRESINTNFENLNNDKLEAADIAWKQDILAEWPFVDWDKTKLDSIEANAEVNNISDVNATDLTDWLDSTLHFHSSDRDRTNHTWTQSADTIVAWVTNWVVTLEEVSAISHNSINGKNGFNPSLSGWNTTIDFSNWDLQFVNRTTWEIVTKSYTWVAGITPTFPAWPTTYIVVDQANIGQPTLDLAISYQATYTLEDLRDWKVLLTKIWTPWGWILDLLPESWNYFDQDVSNAEFINAITPVINEDSSNIIEAWTWMTINKTSWTLLVRGWNPSITNPNRISTGLLTWPTMVSFYRDWLWGSTVTWWITTFNPDVYDDWTWVLATVWNNKWTTKRAYLTSSNLVLFEHWQAEYSTKDDAITGLFFDTYNRLVSEDSILLWAIAMKKSDTQILNENIRLATKLGDLWTWGVASSTTTTWGSITWTLSNQTDLQNALDLKQNILSEGAFVDWDKTKLDWIETGAEVNTINSDPTGVTGADQVTNVMSLTQAEYDAITTPDNSTFYIIT